MQQFRPFASLEDEIDEAAPLHTDQLNPLNNTQPELDALSLLTALQSTMTKNTTGRLVVNPGSKKRMKTGKAEAGKRRRMNPRLRLGIVCGIILLMLGYTLLSLSPLAAGQGSFPGLSAFGNWIRQGVTDLGLSAHLMPATQQQPTTNQGSTTTSLPGMNLPKSQYIAIAQQDAAAAGISPVYFVRQINQESGFNPNAYSPAGAEGIAQFEPGTAAGMGINPWDPIQALRAAAQLMASYNHMYGGNYAKALAAYNGGTGTVQYAVNNCADWLNCLPYETRHYIYVIMGI